MRGRTSARVVLAFLCAWATGCAGRSRETPPIFADPAMYHLRSGTEPEWREFAGRTPHGDRLDLKFQARPPDGEATLFFRQENVKWLWDVQVNGQKLRRLEQQNEPLQLAVALPAGTLREGENVLSVLPPRNPEDIRVGSFRIDPRPLSAAAGEASVDVQVVDPNREGPLPCRVTVTAADGTLAAFLPAEGQRLAVRPGVLYTGDGRARLTLAAGRYTFHATRGFEYGLDTETVALKPGDRRAIVLRIRREVDTPNLVACDTHVHTRELSGHGDASLEERMLTLAGEGIELPVATEHDQHADYTDAAAKSAMARHFTPVPGNEVTTSRGHFNIFPIRAGSAVVGHKGKDWPEVLREIRATPGVKVVVLNHPRGLHTNFIPFGPGNFNPVSGENLRGFGHPYDAMELVNSGALRTDALQTYRDWFAVLNHGHRVVGVGASDSHDVNQYIVGQGRTYLEVRDSDPSRINIAEACESLLQGRAAVSLGLLVLIRVNGRFGPGDLATALGTDLEATVTVLGPSWTQVDRIELYLNGRLVREEPVPVASGGGEKAKRTWRIPRPPNDAHLVAIATGPGVTGPYWPSPRPYQPSSPDFEPRVIGSTNPVWIDADGDGAYVSPRAWARKLVREDVAATLDALAPYDEAVAVQAASLLHAAGRDLRGAPLDRAAEAVRRGFAAYLSTLK